MSPTKTARRFSLLASTSFVAANMLAGLGALTATAFMPSVALAGCNPDGPVVSNPASVTETCAGTDAQIDYTNVAHKFDVILDGETVTTSGISVSSTTGQNLGITNVLNNSSITDTAGFAVILVTTGAGNATVDFSGPTTVSVTGASGVAADSNGSGTATVIFGAGSTINATGGTGIDAESNTGNVNITNDGAVKAAAVGVFGFSDGGTVDYKGTGTITTTGVNSSGLRLESNTLNPAPVTIKAAVDGAIDSGGSGVVVGLFGTFMPSGPVTITTKAAVTGKNGQGMNITATGAGGVNVDAGAAVNGTDGGIVANELGTGNVTIKVSAATTVNGDSDGNGSGGDDGIRVTATTGLVTLSSVAGSTIKGTDAVNVVAGAASTVKTDFAGTVTGVNGDGIDLTGGTIDLKATGAVSGKSGVVNVTGIESISKLGSKIVATGGVTATQTTFGLTAIGVAAGDGPGAYDSGPTVIDTRGGTVTVNSAGYGFGITVYHAFDGAAVDIKTDDIIDNQVGSYAVGGGDGINVYSNGAVTIASKSITTTGFYADGILINTNDPAKNLSTDVKIDVANVTTSGLGSEGIDVHAYGKIDINATGTIKTTGGNSTGIQVESTGKTGTGNITITSNIIEANSEVTTKYDIGSIGISAAGDKNITINSNGAVSAANGGIVAVATGGLIDINVKGTIAGDFGQVKGGDGINALVTTGTIDIETTATGDITTKTANGIVAHTTGAGLAGDKILIKADGDIGATGAGNTVSGDGINALIDAGSKGSIKITGSGSIFAKFDAIEANNNGTGSVSISTTGATIFAAGGDGIHGQDIDGPVTIDANAGAIDAVGDGIEGYTTGNGDVHINGTDSITTKGVTSDNLLVNGSFSNGSLSGWTQSGNTGFTGVQAGGQDAGFEVFAGPVGSDGFISQTFATGVGQPLTITGYYHGDGVGPSNVSFKFDGATLFSIANPPNTPYILVTSNAVGTGSDTFTVGFRDDPGFVNVDNFVVSAHSYGIWGHTDGNGNIFIGDTGLGYSGAIDTTLGGIGILGEVNSKTGTGNVSIKTGVGGTISGKSDDGIVGRTLGLGSVTVDQAGAIGGGAGSPVTKDGINASINNATNTKGVSVVARSDIKAGDDGVDASTIGLGGVTVGQANGTITAGDIGISAVINNAKNVAGNVIVNTNGGAVINAQNHGIFANTNGEGDIFVTNAGSTNALGATGDGIHAEITGPGLVSSDGFVTVTNTGTATSANGTGILAKNNTNDDVVVNNSGTVTGKVDGINANTTGIGGAVTVKVTGGVITQTGLDTGAGINAQITDVGNSDLVFVNITAGKVDAQGNGVFAQTAGTGNVKVDNAGTINGGLSGTAGDGVQANALGGGDVLVNNTGTITGDPGIKASAIGFGTVTVFTTGAVSAVKDGIQTTTVNGTNTVIVSGAGTVTSTTEDGIDAKTTGIGLINIDTAAGTTVLADKNGIKAFQTGTGDIDIDAAGAVTGTKANAIGASTANGTIDIDTFGGLISGKNGIKAVAASASQVTVSVGAGGVTTTNGDGVNASSNGGFVSVDNSGAIDATGGAGIVATTNGAGQAVVSVNANITAKPGGAGNDGVQVTTVDGLAQVTQSTGQILAGDDGIDVTTTGLGSIVINAVSAGGIKTKDDGIFADATGTGSILVHADGLIDSNGDGIDTHTANNTIQIFDTGGIKAGGRGIVADSTAAKAVTVTTGPAAIKATGGEGISASSGGGNVTVDASGFVRGTVAGIKTVTSGAGVTNIDASKTVDGTAGDGVNAFTTGGGLIDIDTADVSGTAAGITAKSTGGSTIKIDNSGAVQGGTGAGIHADTNGAGNITVTLGGTVSGFTGIDIATTGTGTLNVVDGGFAVTGTGGDGIKAAGGTGNVNIGTGPGSRVIGPISGKDDGIDAKGAGNINVYVQGDVTGDSDNDGVGDGIHAETSGAGFAVIVDTTGGAIVGGDDGIEALGVGAGTTVTVTNTDSINVKVDTGIFAQTGDGALTVTNKGAIASTAFGATGANGIWAQSNSGVVKVDNSGDIGTAAAGGGVNNSGITAFNFTGTNSVTVNNTGKIFVDTGGTAGIDAETGGTGDVTVNNDGEIDPPFYGIFAFGGGNVTVNTSKNVTATNTAVFLQDNGVAGKVGTLKTTAGATLTGGAVGVDIRSTVGANLVVDAKAGGAITGGTDGIVASTNNAGNNGTITIDTVAQVTGTVGDGIRAQSVGSGKIDITTGAVTGGDDGVEATSTGGSNITVVTGGAVISGDVGVLTSTTGTGVTSVTTQSTVNAGGDGVNASSIGSGSITVTTNGVVTALGDGVEATSTGGGIVTVTNNAAVTGSGGSGILASSTGAGTVTVNVAGTVVGGTANGVTASSGSGTIAVNDPGSFAITGQVDGINATSTTGNINIGSSTANRIKGVVLGKTDDGIDVLTGGNVNVFTGANVTGGGDTGIAAESTGAAKAVVVDSAGGAIKGTLLGVFTRALGAGSTISITNTDTVDSGDNTNIYARTTTGKIDVDNSGNIANTAFANNSNWGIYTETTTGQITIKNSGQIGTSAASGGLDNFGIQALSTGANTTGITVTNTGAIWMDTGSTAGIWAENTGTGTVTVNNTGAIDPANFGINAKSGGNVVVNNAANILANTGIHAETTSVTTGTVSVFQRAPGTSIVGSAGNGIEAFANAAGNTGAVTVGANTVADRIQGSVTGTGASTNGIFAIGNGDVSVFTGTGTMTGGATGASWGIKAQSLPGGAGAGGAVVVDYQGTSVARLGTLAQANGTDATDTVLVNANGQTIGNDGVAILAASVVGTTVNTSQNVKATDATNTAVGNIAARGILAIATGAAATNNVVVNVTNGATVTSVNGAGTGAQEAIRATANGGDVTVNTTAGGNISGATTGIATVANGGTTTVNTLTSTNSANIKTVTGNAGDGINSTSTSGAIVITTGHVSGSGAAGNTSSGINASASVGGAITVNTTGNITGDGTGNAAGTGAAGIRAVTAGGNGNVVVKADPTTNVVAGNVTGGNYGILANSAGTGSTTVTANVLVNGAGGAAVNTATGPVGISATGGSGGVTVTVAAGVTVQAANGRGIVTDTTSASATGGAIGIGAGAQVRGLGDASHAVIDITNTSVTGRTVLTNAGLIQSFSATPAAYGDLAITGKTGVAGGTTGGTTINNNSGGTINGRLVFSGLTGAANLVFNNAAGGVWHTTGASTFGPGADTITNAGQIFTNNAGSATSIDFGAGADTFTNTGALVAGEAQVAASASNLALTGLETFTNNGQISFGGSVGASDNAINDKINAAGALFGGTGKLFMDADLWSISQATCAALTAADCLAVGTTTGLNSIVVNDINTHAVGAFNPNGIALVTGSTNAGANFKLDPASEWYNAAKFGGVLDKPGLFFYDLAWSAANGGTSLLIGVPDTEVFELSELGNAAQSIWYSSTGTWFDRQADLRQSLAGRSEGWAPSVWLKVVGDWTQRDNITSFSIFNKVYAFDVGYNQDTVGLIGGIDFLNVRDGDEAYVFGGQVGYMDSDVRFNSPTRSNFSGMVVGLYGTYMNGGFFLDGIANANFLDLHHYVPTLPGPPAPGSANADVTSFGGQVEAGYQMAIGATGFWEPLASLAYVHTEIDALSLGGNGSVDFPSTVSFRGSLGARVGMSGDFQYYKVRVALTGRLWDEFDGDNSIVVISPGPSNFATNDDFGGTFGEVTLGGNLFTTGGNLSAFANVGVKFRSDYQSTNVSVGFRYQW